MGELNSVSEPLGRNNNRVAQSLMILGLDWLLEPPLNFRGDFHWHVVLPWKHFNKQNVRIRR
jgi:hypothetical protein